MLCSRQTRCAALQWRALSSTAAEGSISSIRPTPDHPHLRYVLGHRSILARTTDMIASPLDAYIFIRAIERRFGRVAEFRFHRDAETRAFQFRAYLAFEDPAAYARVSKESSTLIQAIVPAKPPAFEGLGLEELEDAGVLEPKDWQDGDLAEEVRTMYEEAKPKDGERVMRIHVEHFDGRFQNFQYLPPLYTKRFLPILSRNFVKWGGFAPMEPRTEVVTRSQVLFGDANIDRPAMRYVLQKWAPAQSKLVEEQEKREDLREDPREKDTDQMDPQSPAQSKLVEEQEKREDLREEQSDKAFSWENDPQSLETAQPDPVIIATETKAETTEMKNKKSSPTDTTPIKSNALPTKVDAPPTKSDALPTKVDVPPTKFDVLPTKVDAPPTKSDTLPLKVDAPTAEVQAEKQPEVSWKTAPKQNTPPTTPPSRVERPAELDIVGETSRNLRRSVRAAVRKDTVQAQPKGQQKQSVNKPQPQPKATPHTQVEQKQSVNKPQPQPKAAPHTQVQQKQQQVKKTPQAQQKGKQANKQKPPQARATSDAPEKEVEPRIEVEERVTGMRDRLKKVLGGWF